MRSNPTDFISQAHDLIERGKLEQASRILKQALRDPDPANSVAGHYYLGLVEYQRHHYLPAAELIEKALSLNASDPSMLASMRNNAGLAWLAADRPAQAVRAFSLAIEHDPNYVQAWFNRGNAWRAHKDLSAARADYLQALVLDPYLAIAHNNLGLVLQQAGEILPAIEHFEKALQIQPDYAIAMNNLGLAKQTLGQTDAALRHYHNALAVAPDYVEAHVNAGNVLQQRGNYDQALPHYVSAYKLAPQLDLLLGNLIFCKAMMCDWQDFNALWRQVARQAAKGAIPCSPVVMLAGCDDPRMTLQLARRYSEVHVPLIDSPPCQDVQSRPVNKIHSTSEAEHGAGSGSESEDESRDELRDGTETQIRSRLTTVTKRKLRIGYVSSDFREHPVAYLMVGILENHDRDAFEVIGFAIGPPGQDPLGQRVRASVDHFIDLSSATDLQAIETIRAHELDIAIDLNGYIDGCRPGIFRARIAPIQVNYYGYPGTMGARFIDYIVGDRHLMPCGFDAFYQEKIIYLPQSYQPNDDQRPIATSGGNRRDHGLPQDAVVFCCFNKPYKITPPIFECWMQILKAVPDGVLWLQSTDQIVITNLRKAAHKAGLKPDRLVFAGRVATTADHLARYRLADLFLDTLPFTAHTTANDALWAGLPVLGLSGQTFSARVSESLLATLGLPDLVMRALPDYQARAIDLARHPEQIVELRKRLEQGKQDSALYRPAQIARWLEQGLRIAHARYTQGLEPDHIMVQEHAAPQ